MKLPLCFAVLLFGISGLQARAEVVPSNCDGASNKPARTSSSQSLWAQMAFNDLTGLKAILEGSHPGAVDPANPAVRSWISRGYVDAERLAKCVVNYDGAYFVLRRFIKGFNDEHVILFESLANTRAQYPGFTAALRRDHFVVTASEDPTIPIGANILTCEGTRTVDLYRKNVVAFYGVDGVRADFIGYSPYLFADLGNPFVNRPSTCQLLFAGKTISVPLNWRVIKRQTLLEDLHDAAYGKSAELGIDEWMPGYFWIGLPDFAFTSDDGRISSTADRMNALIEEARRQAPALRAAKVIVFDIRGNQGGSSAWGEKLLQAIWGQHITDDLVRQTYDRIEWRASEGNISANEKYAESYKAKFGVSDSSYQHLATLVTAMKSAQASGRDFVDDPDQPPDRSKAHSPVVTPRLILLGNGTCFSACNDFSDAVLSFKGAELWGADNAADSAYIDNRGESLPSGLFRVSLPMKVWRGRYRGNNVPYTATRRFDVPFNSKSEAQRWVESELAKPESR